MFSNYNNYNNNRNNNNNNDTNYSNNSNINEDSFLNLKLNVPFDFDFGYLCMFWVTCSFNFIGSFTSQSKINERFIQLQKKRMQFFC